VFCPFCGSATEIQQGSLVCAASGMDFSEKVREELTAVAEQPPTVAAAARVRWGGHWRCPADGEPMVEAEGVVACRACMTQLPPLLIYQLIEFHVHLWVPTTSSALIGPRFGPVCCS
jgi:hypothetical protein